MDTAQRKAFDNWKENYGKKEPMELGDKVIFTLWIGGTIIFFGWLIGIIIGL